MFGHEKIEVLLSHRRYREAEAAIREELKDSSDDLILHMFLSISLLGQEKYKGAEGAARDSIALDPDFDSGYFYLARALIEQCRYKEALKVVDKAIELDPEDADNWGLKSRVLCELARNTEGLAAAEMGLKHDPENDTCGFYRTVLLGMSGRHEEADEGALELLAHDPDDAENHCARGWARLAGNDAGAAEEHFVAALKIDPSSEDAKSGLTSALKMRNPIMSLVMRSMIRLSNVSHTQALIAVIAIVVLGKYFSDHSSTLVVVLGRILWVGFYGVFLVWLVIDPLFNLALLRSKKGRLALSEDQKTCLKWALAPMVIGIWFFVSWVLRGAYSHPTLGIAWIGTASLVDEIFEGTKRSVRFRMALLSGLSAVVAIGVVVIAYAVVRPKLLGVSELVGPEATPGELSEELGEQLQSAVTIRKRYVVYPGLGILLLACFRSEIREKFEAITPDE